MTRWIPRYLFLITPLCSLLTIACMKCQCSSANDGTLQCEPSNLNSTIWSTCPPMQCQDSNQLYIGSTTSSSICNQTTCAYSGYTNQTILTNLSTLHAFGE